MSGDSSDQGVVRRVVLDHVGITVADMEASRRFYAGALAPLGLVELGRDEAGGAGFGAPGLDDFWLTPAGPDPVTRGVHLAFAATSREQVDAFHAAALAAGGTDRAAPRVRPEYSGGYYAAFVSDPDGNNVEAVHHA